mgnify:CR=1 FL=1
MEPVVYLGAVLVVGALAQWLAWAVKVPSILVLLIVGFLGGLYVSPDEVLGREVLFAGVTLAARPTTQLVVDTARFVAFRANHMQTTQLTHQCHLLHILFEGIHRGLLLLIEFNVQGVHCRQTLGHGHVVRIQIALLSQYLIEL